MRYVMLASLGLALAACGAEDAPSTGGPATAPTEISGDDLSSSDVDMASVTVEITDGFIMAPFGGRDVTMGGMRITVQGGDVRLIGAALPSADATELHTVSMEDGVMQMRQVDGFEIADGETVVLERGGNHLMMFGVDSLNVGDDEEIELVLETEDGAILNISHVLTVRALGE